jgi:hypothetical protein
MPEYFKTPKQENLTDYAHQIYKIQTDFAPNDIPSERYLPYLQNYNVFCKLFDRNVNLSIKVHNVRDSQYDILVSNGFLILDYTLINQTESTVLTIDKQYLIDNNCYPIIFATYDYPLETQDPNDYQLGVVIYNPDTESLVTSEEYADQAYDLFINATNKLILKIFQIEFNESQYIELPVYSVTIDGELYTTLLDADFTMVRFLFGDALALDFGEY